MAQLTITPSAPNEVLVTLDTQGALINAVELHLSFDPQEFTVAGVSDGGSVMNLWIQNPTFSNTSGTLDMSGIIPGGVTTMNGAIVKIAIIPKETKVSQGFSLNSAIALLNDGRGTPAKITVINKSIPLTVAQASNSGSTAVPFDTQGPDPFTPQIAHDPNLFNGQYFLVFATTDQHAGIDHYEVLERNRNQTGSAIPTWQKEQSPYLLKDQALSSNIYVRAIDTSGNFRVVRLQATNPTGATAWSRYGNAVGIGFGILIVITVLWLAWKQKRKRSRK